MCVGRSRCQDSNKTTAEGNPSKYALKMMITMMTTLAMTVCHNWLTSASKVMIDAVLACWKNVYGMLTLVSIMLTIYDEFYACTADAILSDFEKVETIQQANQLALRDVNPTTRTLRELACSSNTKINW